jgi:CRP-like cAMP-binding protein
MHDYPTFLKGTFLFADVSENDISRLLEGMNIEQKTYRRGDLIFSPDGYEHKVGFVIEGECLIGRQSGGFVPLNSIAAGGSFGILTVFSAREEFPTLVKAKTQCSILFFSADEIKQLVEKSPAVSMNVIRFMAQKINFLNDKIAAFSGGSVEEKLAGYLLELVKKHHALTFDFNKKKSAEALNCGRASLYRAISSLESEGYISFNEKKINITDAKGLERILK